MILFTRRLMAAGLRLQSDRETHESEIYFTNRTLTGKPNAFPWLGSDTARRFRGPYGARHLYFTNCTLTGKPEAYSSGSQTPPCDPQAALSVQKVGREILAAFISPITL
jgi:hypothetical protein